jgi:glycosyltransferase involved in cell wall biosynthesis
VADRLHVAVDGRELVGKPTGVGRYLSSVLREWTRSDGPDRVSVVVPGDPQASLVAAAPGVDWVLERAETAGTWWEQTRLASAVTRTGADVLFAPGYTAPLRLRRPTVLAVHDVSFFAHPEWFPPREGLRRRLVTRAAARRAAVVITLSEFSAGEVVRWLGVPRDRVRLAPPAAEAPAAATTATPRQAMVLYVGSLFTRRHIPDLIQGFARAAPFVDDARLVLIGDNRTNPPIDPASVAAEAGVGDRVEWRDYVSDADLADAYATARVFAFLSDYEGFGIPPLEALAAGVPPLVLDTPLSHEVYGDAALCVPADPDAIGRALVTLLTDEDARARILAAGARQLPRYSWRSTAQTIRAALREAVDA